MEALGAAASITQFVLLSLKCVKEAHDALSQYKDGPDILKRLRNDLLCAQNILETLRHSANVPANPVLDAHIQQSIEGICSIAEHLVKLQATPGDNGGKRLWKHLKIVLSENDMNRIRSELAQIVNNLNVRLSVLSWNTISQVRDETHQIQQKMRTMDESLQYHHLLQASGFQALENNVLTTYNGNHGDLQSRLSSIQQTINSTSSISMSSSTDMCSLLNEIKDLVVSEAKATREASTSNNVGSDSTASKPQKSAMLESIERLGALIDEKRETVDVYAEDDELAESAIDDLRNMLTAVRGGEDLKLEKELDKGLRRFGRSFGQSKLSINAQSHDSHRVVGRVLSQERHQTQADIGIGKVSLRVHKRKRKMLATDNKNVITTAEGHLTDYTMSLLFLPDKRSHHMLMASLTQRELLAGSVSSISRLQVNRLLPLDSPVFRVVAQGNLQGLLQMLQNGEASLRDHAENGASLLFYSMKQPEMCKFLIEEGLDVDHVSFSSRSLPNSKSVNCLQSVMVGMDVHQSKKDLKSINACRRLLLTAGADPTYVTEVESFLDSVATNADDEETLALVWNSELIAPFATFQNWRTRAGMSPFLKACTRLDRNKDIISHFLKIGACIDDRAPDGATCLRLVLECTTSTIISFEHLVLLLEHEADPFAKDNEGTSISEVAYNRLGLRDEILGSYGDVWDAALHVSGWDIRQFRTIRRREPRYDEFYTRADFEQLWRGREDECPYWDDIPWPPLGGEEGDSDFDRDDMSYFELSSSDISEDKDKSGSCGPIQEVRSDSEDEDGGALL
uniref:Azaphilone pigments biosynthesis cluster protein L N-terminal domain-containing protein n=1 Tax=Gibberella zeae (strain ATCC MYA-4620 / CBS 123657 / FGSC 9075 / NRRL 31084 / PH-1) TaxID=229533 RepID=A0A098DNM1_GIBZE